jgi:hypothetical protein
MRLSRATGKRNNIGLAILFAVLRKENLRETRELIPPPALSN